MIRRLSVWLFLSVAIHAALIGLTLALAAVTPAPMLFVDLVHGVLATTEPAPGGDIGRGDGTPARGVSAAAPARPARPERSKPVPAIAASPVRTVRAPAETIASPPVPEPDPVPPPEPIRPLPGSISPATERPRLLVELSAPLAPAPARVGEISDTPAPSGGGDGASPGSSGPVSGPVMDRGDGTASGPASGGRGAAAYDAGLGLGAREGSALALAVPGERGGEGSEYAGYYALLRGRVQEALTYPATARRRELTGTVQLEIDIQPTGAITQVVLAVSSSHRVLDEAALQAVRGIERLPFPPDLRPRRLRVRLPVVFALR